MFTSNKDPSSGNSNEEVRAMKRKGEELRDDLGELAQEAGHYARKVINATNEAARASVSSATDVAKTQMRDKPIQTTLLAMGVGFILGALFRR